MITWRDESCDYGTLEKHVCFVKGVGVIAIERVSKVSRDWLLCTSKVMGPLDLKTSDPEEAKTLALRHIHLSIKDMMRSMDEVMGVVQ